MIKSANPGASYNKVRFVDAIYLSIRKALDSLLCQLAAEELWTGRNDA